MQIRMTLRGLWIAATATLALLLASASHAAPIQDWLVRTAGTPPVQATGAVGFSHALAVDAEHNTYVTGSSPNGSFRDILTVKYSPAGAVLWSRRIAIGFVTGAALALDAASNVYVTGTSANYEYLTVKYSADGVELWQRKYTGGGSSNFAYALAVDGSGNAYVTGRSQSSAGNDDIATVKYDAAGTLQWVRRIDGTGNGYDSGNAIALDGSGNAYVAGSTTSASGANNVITLRYASDGTLSWAREYNGSGNGNDYANAIALDAVGNVFVGGLVQATAMEGGANCATLKYDNAGNLLWEREYNGSGNGNDYANAIALDAAGNVFNAGVARLPSGAQNFIVLKYDGSGGLQWAKESGGSDDDQNSAVVVDTDGNVYSSGTENRLFSNAHYLTVKYDSAGVQQWSAGMPPSETGESVYNRWQMATDAMGNTYVGGRSFNGARFEWLIQKISVDGTVAWSRGFGAPDSEDGLTALGVDASGNVYATGYSGSYLVTVKYDGDGKVQWQRQDAGVARSLAVGADGSVYVTGVTINDAVTLKISAGGALQWTREYNSANNLADSAQDVVVDGSGNVFVVGFTLNNADNSREAFIVSYDSAGTQRWVQVYGDHFVDYGWDIALDATGNVFVAGSTSEANAPGDLMVLKYTNGGAPLWARFYNGSGNGGDGGAVLALDATGNVIVAGSAYSAAGNYDYVTVKYDNAGTLLWSREYNGSGNGDDAIAALAIGSNGDVYVTGNAVGASGGGNFLTLKYTADGTARWTHEYNSADSSNDGAHALAATADGHVVIVGTEREYAAGSHIVAIRLYDDVIFQSGFE